MLGHSHMIFSAATAVVVNTLIIDVTHASLAGAPINLTLTGSLLPLATQSLSSADVLFKSMFYCGIIFGSLLPDIDHPHSTISRIFPLPGHIISHYFKHRTITHSLPGIFIATVFWGIVLSLGLGLLGKFGLPLSADVVHAFYVFYIATTVGCLLHSFEDTMTYSGVPWLYPISKKCQHLPLIRFRTGGMTEYAVVLVAILLVGLGLLTHVLVI